MNKAIFLRFGSRLLLTGSSTRVCII